MHALEGLQIFYNRSKEGDIYHTVVEIILKNIHKIGNSTTIYDIAEMCYVSPTTISRLSKKLGYSGFQEFKSSIVNTVKSYEALERYVSFKDSEKYDNTIIEYFNMIENQMKGLKDEIQINELDRLANMIHACRNINFYTNGIIFAEHRFQGDLITAGHMSKIKISHLEQLENIPELTPEDLVIMISPLIHDRICMTEIMRKIKEQGAKLFVLTDSYYPLYKKYADELYSLKGYWELSMTTGLLCI